MCRLKEINMQSHGQYEKANKAYWSNRASGYSNVNRNELDSGQHQRWAGTLNAYIERRYPDRSHDEIAVLDIGTGPGFFAIILAELGYRVTAVDYTESMLEKARINAGRWYDRIQFRKMNAEELDFEAASFDVIVTRNLTWNLPNPEKAYGEWTRVLKPGGLLLNFDANWYNYLYHEEAREGYLRDRENIRKSGVANENEADGTDIPAMEAIAYKAPLSALRRPGWDEKVLNGMDMDVRTDTDIWKIVWTREEKINNASTPMFLVQAVKRQVSCGL
mgnify:CR=1 FL=1